MSVNLDIKLKRAFKVYRNEENVTGAVIITTNSDFKHEGITLTMEGTVNLQISNKNVGILEAFYNSVKPIQLLNVTCEVCGPGKLPSGTTQIVFEMPLKTKNNKDLYETYHGVYVNISYSLRCDVKRSFLSKDLQKSQQFLVQYWPGTHPVKTLSGVKSGKPVNFELSPTSLSVGGAGAPDFLIKGKLDTTICNIANPLKGHLKVIKCASPIRSIELQLVRVETCGCAEGYAKEATEIQNIQIGDGDVPQNISIPIYMIFPRLFTCPTLITTNFKIEFEVNLVVVFHDDHLVTNNFPIVLIRE